MRSYLLLDGIQLGSTDLASHLPTGEQVYRDFGEAAGLVGPILVESDDAVEAVATRVEQQAPRRFAIARLQSEAGRDHLASHLRHVRYFCPNSHEQFFLRYADTRVFINLMQILDNAQKQALFGPLSAWSVNDREGNPTHHVQPGVASLSAPLLLSNSQHLELLRLSRPDQLLADVIADDPELVLIGTEAERHGWARQALEFVETHRARSFPYRLAVGAAAVRTRGLALRDPGFAETLRAAVGHPDGAERLHAWNPLKSQGGERE